MLAKWLHSLKFTVFGVFFGLVESLVDVSSKAQMKDLLLSMETDEWRFLKLRISYNTSKHWPMITAKLITLDHTD